jgi:hypothetical protein
MTEKSIELNRFAREYRDHWRTPWSPPFSFTDDDGDIWSTEQIKLALAELNAPERLDRALALVLPDLLGIYRSSGGLHMKYPAKKDVSPHEDADVIRELELLLPGVKRRIYLLTLQRHLPDSSLWALRTADPAHCVMAMLEAYDAWPFKTWEEPHWIYAGGMVALELQASGIPFDGALPQEFFDEASKALKENALRHFVWAYPKGCLGGLPCPKTLKAKDWLDKSGMPYYDAKLALITQHVRTFHPTEYVRTFQPMEDN